MTLLARCFFHLLPGVIVLSFPSAFAQSFKIGSIDVYGNRIIPADTVYRNLIIREGDSVNFESFKEKTIVDKLKLVQGIRHAAVNAVCCNDKGEVELYVGISENDSHIVKYRKAPVGDIKLPANMLKSYNTLLSQLEPAITRGEATEDETHGYSLITYAPAQKEQLKFIQYASKNLSLLWNVIKNSRYPEHRAAAAQIVAYSDKRKQVVEYLMYAVDDANDEVRNNATRALGILAGYAVARPELKINIPAGPFIEMMNSIVWTDRNKGAIVLVQLTQSKDSGLLSEIKQKALPSVVEMAKWKNKGHSFFSLVILARLAGADESELLAVNKQEDLDARVNALVSKLQQVH